jgi:hypothetical protein
VSVAVPLTPALSHFISTRIASREELEVLLLLRRCAGEWRSAEEVASQLNMSAARTLAALERMSGGFLEVRVTNDICFRFAPINAERETLAAALHEAYEKHRPEVVRHIAGRSQPAEDFADAFRLRRKE